MIGRSPIQRVPTDLTLFREHEDAFSLLDPERAIAIACVIFFVAVIFRDYL